METQAERLESLLRYSCEKKVTDLHLCAGSRPLVRIGGRLSEVADSDTLKHGHISEMIDSIIDENKKRILSERRVLDFSFSKSKLGRFRANVYSQRGTFAVAVRILPFEIPAFATLGLPRSVEDFTAKTQGLFLVTGTTGSGKSTTLASLLDAVNKKYNYHVITIEDPIEFIHHHDKSLITQREIGSDADSFADALRSALREDPDIIMVGEMRDPETIAIALTAAETGHLVLSTLHTVGAIKSIDRILDAFPPNRQNQIRSQLAAVLEGVVSQALIPRVDSTERVIASEVMFVNLAIRNLIREGKHYQINSIMQTGQGQGMQILEADLAKMYNDGIISMENAFLHADDRQLLQQYMNRKK